MSEISILIANYHPHNSVNCRRNLHHHAGANDSFMWVVIEMAGLRFKVALDILHPCACASAIPHEIQVPRYITFTLPGYNAKIFQHKPWRPKGFFIWNNVLVNCFCFIWIPMLWVYGYKCLISFSAGIDFRRHNLTSIDVSLWRLESIPALKGLTCDASTIACGLCLRLWPNVISVLYQHLILLMLQNQVTSKQKHSGRKRHNLWKLKRDIISFLCDLDVRPRHTVVRPRHTVVRPRHTVVRPRHTVVRPRHTVVRPRHTVVRPRHTTVRPRQSNVLPYLAQCLPLPGPTFVLARVLFSPAWSNVLPCLSHVLPCPCQAKCLSQPGAVDIL